MPFTKGDKNAGSKNGISNSEKNRPGRDALNRLIKQSNGAELRRIAQALLDKAAEGDVPAIREVLDRTDGKVVQGVDANVDTNLVVEIVRFSDE